MLLALPSPLLASFPSHYDDWFQYSAERFTPRPWQALKAQGWQESRLNPEAVSPAGARGVMQFTGRAWLECSEALGFDVSPHNPKASIICGGWYMQRMAHIWRGRERTDSERWPLALASYNAGAGSILKAQKRCNNERDWQHIVPCLPNVTGFNNSTETVRYVVLVKQWFRAMQ
jgi:membrane-bound lytic murein transglycosylase MltF